MFEGAFYLIKHLTQFELDHNVSLLVQSGFFRFLISRLPFCHISPDNQGSTVFAFDE